MNLNKTALFKDLRYYRNIENGNQPSFGLYQQCRCNWKLAQWLNRLLTR